MLHHQPELTLYEGFPLRGLCTHTPACRADCRRRAVCALRVQARHHLNRHADLDGLLARVRVGEEVRSKNRLRPTWCMDLAYFADHH